MRSSCIYPKQADQPIKEISLLTGPLELTNSAYAVAKIAGKEMCDAYAKQHDFDAFTVRELVMCHRLTQFYCLKESDGGTASQTEIGIIGNLVQRLDLCHAVNADQLSVTHLSVE